MTILTMMRKQKKRLGVSFVVICGATLLAFVLTNGKIAFSLLPVEEASAGPVCRFQYTAANKEQIRMLYVESWQSGELAWRIPLLALEDTGVYSLKVTSEPDEKLLWCVSWDDKSVAAETTLTSGFVYDGLTQETLGDWEGETDIILLCLGFGDLEQGIPAIDCLALMNSAETLTDYQEVQLVRME